jgi:tetratricopeptide (TPR) repeat protein
MAEKTLYDALGIDFNSTIEDINNAFLRKTAEMSKLPLSKVKEIQNNIIKAFRVLSDSKTRSEYDLVMGFSTDAPIKAQLIQVSEETSVSEFRGGNSSLPAKETIKILPGDLQIRNLTFFEKVQNIVRKGHVNKVQVKWGSTVIIPAMPLALFLAAQAATFIGAGLFRAIIANVAGTALLEVEFINDAETHYDEGQRRYSSGDLVEAIRELKECLEIESNHVGAYYHLGVSLKALGHIELAILHFEKAISLDPHGSFALKSKDQLLKLR